LVQLEACLILIRARCNAYGIADNIAAVGARRAIRIRAG
jgi:hypothetical protein